MSNPIYSALAQKQESVAGMLQQFQEFRNNFQGDPKQQIQQLLNSGKISQAQYDQAVQTAKAFQNMLGIK